MGGPTTGTCVGPAVAVGPAAWGPTTAGPPVVTQKGPTTMTSLGTTMGPIAVTCTAPIATMTPATTVTQGDPAGTACPTAATSCPPQQVLQGGGTQRRVLAGRHPAGAMPCPWVTGAADPLGTPPCQQTVPNHQGVTSATSTSCHPKDRASPDGWGRPCPWRGGLGVPLRAVSPLPVPAT